MLFVKYMNLIFLKVENYSFFNDLEKLATFVEDNPKAQFLIATTLRCKGGRHSIPWIALLYP